MALLNILHFPDPRLRKNAQPVTQVDDAVRKIVDDMLETMYAAPGIGLAATQVDIHQQIIVIDISEQKNQPLCLINPKIITREGELYSHEEGCLSVPSIYESVERPERVTVEALNRAGDTFTLNAEGLLAVCIQHEMDHLQGRLFIDHLSSLKRQRVRKKMQKGQKVA